MQKMASHMSGLNSAQVNGLEKRGPNYFDSESPISLLKQTPKRFMESNDSPKGMNES